MVCTRRNLKRISGLLVLIGLSQLQLLKMMNNPETFINQVNQAEGIVTKTGDAPGTQTEETSFMINEKNTKLVVFNALGKVHNLPLVKHARRNVFKPGEWDCIAFMFAKEDRIPNNNTDLRILQDELGCTIPRTPGLHWGNFLRFVPPLFVSKYDYVALVLDDMLLSSEGPFTVDANKLIQRMQTHNIDVITPGIVGDTWNFKRRARKRKVEGCVTEIGYIETYVQIFTREAWKCFYSMFHYTGGKGWCYDIFFKCTCPKLKLAQDFTMTAWHMDRKQKKLPYPYNEKVGTDLAGWKPEPPIVSEEYNRVDTTKICKELLGTCNMTKQFEGAEKPIKDGIHYIRKIQEEIMEPIYCPAS